MTELLTTADERVAAGFLAGLRDELDAAGEYGSQSWRRCRDAQIHRLHERFDWEVDVIAAHFRLGRNAVRAALSRHDARERTPLAAHAASGETEPVVSATQPGWTLTVADSPPISLHASITEVTRLLQIFHARGIDAALTSGVVR
ncbi:hypothetical protein [Gordonia jacobaea]|uniref:hypothetical protein n=1 Tax=Gordonia jacobaea TaxID=122202 RepID=UPI003D7269CA